MIQKKKDNLSFKTKTNEKLYFQSENSITTILKNVLTENEVIYLKKNYAFL